MIFSQGKPRGRNRDQVSDGRRVVAIGGGKLSQWGGTGDDDRVIINISANSLRPRLYACIQRR